MARWLHLRGLGASAVVAVVVLGNAGALPGSKAIGGWVAVPQRLSPSARESALMAYDVATRQLLLVGGFRFVPVPNSNVGHEIQFEDTWVWRGSSWHKTDAALPSTPQGQDVSAAAYDPQLGGVVLVSPRFRATTVLPARTWLWTGSRWRVLPFKPSPPVSGGGVSLAYDGATGGMVALVNGAGTWVLRPQGWAKQAGPGPSTGDLVYDPVSRQVLAFDAGSSKVWTWDRRWTGHHAMTPPLEGLGLVYDPILRLVVGYGRQGVIGLIGPTYCWSDGAWTTLDLRSQPDEQIDVALAYDGARHELVLFGGLNAFGRTLDSTWVLTGPSRPS